MTSARTASTVLLLLAAGAIDLARGGAIYDNGQPDLQEAATSDFAGLFGSVEAGDDFSVRAGNVIHRVQFWGIYAFQNTPPASDDFTIRLFDIVAGVPEVDPFLETQVLGVTRSDTGFDLGLAGGGTADLYEYVVDVSAVELDPARDTLLSVVNDTATDPDDEWAWATSSVGRFFLRFPGEEWSPFSFDLAFALRDDFCGDGVIDDIEECDDGVDNGRLSSCCTAACKLISDGTRCENGDPCTSGDTCHAAMCEPGGPTLLEPLADAEQTLECVLSAVR